MRVVLARATAEPPERLGVVAESPAGRTCRGQVHIDTGYQQEALPLVRRFVDIEGEPG